MTDYPTIVSDRAESSVPIYAVSADSLDGQLSALDDGARRFAQAQKFEAKGGRYVLLPDPAGNIAAVLFGIGDEGGGGHTPLGVGKLASCLPPGTYRLAGHWPDPHLATLGFVLGSYRFDRYRKAKDSGVRLLATEEVDVPAVNRTRDGVFMARDLINTPANELSPHDLARAAGLLADRFGASISVLDGDTLVREFPMIHAVGAGSDRPPCLVDMRWGSETDPKVTLIGKGIVFDTGGLDIKNASGMLIMKKDMGGAANVLGLASMIMAAGLKVRLRVLIPAAENAISGRAFRPGDILRSRKGLSVEIGNTDAEGRLVLADALSFADEEAPDLLVTLATLTGAARVALGPDLPPFFTDDEEIADDLESAAAQVYDPIWRLPFWKPYDAWLTSKIADLNNVSSNSFAGSIVAALFLRRFVKSARSYVHFDIYAWNPAARPTGPEGGEAQAIRALFALLAKRFG